MDAAALLRTLQEIGCELRAEGDALRVNSPKGTLTGDLRAAIRERKMALIGLLSAGLAQGGPSSPPAPRIPGTVAEEIRRIEDEASSLGWTHEELWGVIFWNIGPDGVNRPGLAATMFPGYRITQVTAEAIVMLAGPRGHRLTALRRQGRKEAGVS
jgi:hypothetical protein